MNAELNLETPDVSDLAPRESGAQSPASAPARQTRPMSSPPNTEKPQQWLTFGSRAALRPEPRVAPQQSDSDYVADSECDWINLGPLAVRAASVRGHMHRYEGTIRQDSFAVGSRDGFLLLAVADGVGSASHSHLGSRFVTATAVSDPMLVAEADEILGDSSEVPPQHLTHLQSALESVAADRGLDPGALSTTFLFAAVKESPTRMDDGRDVYHAVLWSIGDSEFLRITSSGVDRLSAQDEPAEDEIVDSSTRSLPLQVEAMVWVETFEAGETLALVTDGVVNILGANSEFRQHVVDEWSQSSPTPAALMTTLDATVKSFDDDRTFVGVRFPDGPRER